MWVPREGSAPVAERLRAGVVGLGAMGRNHARVLRSLEGVDLVGVVDPAVAGDPGQPDVVDGVPLHPSLDGLLDAGIDCCVVAAPTAHHRDVAVQLAEAGVHVLVEKPLAGDVSAASAIADAVERAGVVGAVGHIERCNPALIALRQRLEAGELGEVHQIATSRQGPFPERIADVGVVLDLATHDVDLTAWVGGSPYASVTALTAHKAGRAHEDLLAATGRLADGTVTTHQVNWLNPTKERTTVILGEKGKFVADTVTADLTFHANGTEPLRWDAMRTFRGVTEGDVTRYAIPKREPLVVELEAFRDAILGVDSTAAVVSVAEGLQAVRVAEALLASARTGQTVEVVRP